jgi:atypical dual specificity phosphatase
VPTTPTFLYWVIPDVLAGMSMPFIHPERRMRGGGALQQFEDELPILANAGIRGVISLLNIPNDASLYAEAGFDFLCLPVGDGRAPTIDQVIALVGFIDNCRSRSAAVAIHCEAGCGRTGTMLCAYIIAKGESPENALNTVRAVERSAVETAVQIKFLYQLPNLWSGHNHVATNPNH